MREPAVLLSGFLATEGATLPVAELRLLERLLDTCADPDLTEFLLGAQPWPDWAGRLSTRIESYLRVRRTGS